MTIENKNGILIISDIIDDQLITRQYIFITKKMAIANFKKHIKNIKLKK